jgi:galactose mutarotase-like enzyme
VSDRPPEAVLLRDEQTALEAAFIPGAGMLCCSLRHRGEELLAQRSGVDAYAELGKTMGIPLLYPWANRLAGFEYTVGASTVTLPDDLRRVARDDHGLPIHGVIGGRLEWELTQTPSVPGQSLSARLTWADSRPELFELFPFRHDLEYKARLADGALEIDVIVRACGSDAVPVSFGFHPYLSLPGLPRERWLIDLPSMTPLALDDMQIPVDPGEPLPAERFELAQREFDDAFVDVSEPSRFTAEAGGRRIALSFLDGYPCAQVFAPRADQFICFEPMTAPANALRSGVGLRLLAPGESSHARFSVHVTDVA